MRPILRNWGYSKLTPGVIDNGEWKQPDDILKGLAGLWWQERLSRGRVVAGLGGPRIQIRRIRFDKMNHIELRNRVAEEVKFYLPYDPETAALDFQIIGTSENYLDVLVVTIPHAQIERDLKLLSVFGLEPHAVEVPAVALYNLWYFNYREDRDCFLINVGSTMTQLVYIQDRKPLSIRTLVWGTKDCMARIQKQLGIDYLSTEKALTGERESEEVSSIVVDFAQELFEKLEADRKFLPEGYAYTTCYLSGGGSLLAHLVNYLEPRLNCTRFEPFRNFEIPSARQQDSALELAPVFAVAAGLALRGLYD